MAKKFTKQAIKSLNTQAIEVKDGLVESVTAFILNKFDEYDDSKKIVLEVLEYGCSSGIVGELCYYSDTTAYYAKNKEEINKLLYETMDECGIYDLKDLFRHWDEKDPLALDCCNQNILAWFGFEETLRKVASKFEDFEEYI